MACVVATSCGQPSEPSAAAPAGTAGDPLLGPAEPATGSPVRIGLFNVEDNPLADLRSTGDAAAAAAAYANDHLGGLAGHRIEVVRCADKVDEAAAAACADQVLPAGGAGGVGGAATARGPGRA